MTWRTLSLAGAVMAASVTVGSAMQCGPAESVLKQLHDRYNEVPTFTGDANGVAVTILVSPAGTWTVLGRQGDQVCLLASGEHWAAMPALPAPKIEPNSLPAPLPTPALLRFGMIRI